MMSVPVMHIFRMRNPHLIAEKCSPSLGPRARHKHFTHKDIPPFPYHSRARTYHNLRHSYCTINKFTSATFHDVRASLHVMRSRLLRVLRLRLHDYSHLRPPRSLVSRGGPVHKYVPTLSGTSYHKAQYEQRRSCALGSLHNRFRLQEDLDCCIEFVFQ